MKNRRSRYQVMLAAYPDAFADSVLDLGCDVRHLADIAKPRRYVGVGLDAGSELIHNLEQTPYPFADREFDTVVCFDVLEHLEAIHAAAAEMFRIAQRRVIVTIPNPIDHILAVYLFRKHYRKAQWTKFHSLTPEPPADRHRWFYCEEEADLFFEALAKRHGFTIGRCYHHRLGWRSHVLGFVFGLIGGRDVFGKWTLAYEFTRCPEKR